MWEPVGPLPASVYWRRRLVALGCVIATFALVGVTIAGATGPDEPGHAPAVQAATLVSDVAPVTAAPTVDRVENPRDSPGPPPAEPPPAESPSAAPPPAEPPPCTNAMLTAGAEIDRPVHRVGERPVLRVVITNISDRPCIRDLDGKRLEIVVWSGDGVDRLWSSNDCVNPARADVRTLAPGEPVAFAVTWAGRTSSPGCAEPRRAVPAGAYRVMTRIDDLISAPTPFLLI
ncbi:hypothetical protein ACFQE5_05850 [Pseudonocardia hispaniensis]|uniref:DUF4232 domain-containing protein n=1 Tax=Pseudonocardia hispaniensis TaxID=904933 RepID=A0ABW1IZA9_9PSEU